MNTTPNERIPTFQELVESGLKKVSKALRFMVTKRNEVEEKRKELKADSLAYGKAVDNRAKEIVHLLAPIEEHLRIEKENIDEEIEAIKERKIREEQERLNVRNRRLLQAGMKLVGNEYFWQNPNNLAQVEILPSVNLETMEDLAFDEYIENISKVVREQQAIFEEEQKRLADEKAKFEEEQRKFRAEVEKMKNQRTQMRLESLYGLGLKSITHLNAVCYIDGTEFIPVISYPTVVESENWELELENVVNFLAQLKNKMEAEERAKQEELEKLKKEAEELAIQKLKEENERKELLEQERIAQMSDKDKFTYYYILPTIRLWWEERGEISINFIWFNRSFDIIIRD